MAAEFGATSVNSVLLPARTTIFVMAGFGRSLSGIIMLTVSPR